MPDRLPPPWSIITHEAAFEIVTATGQSVAFVYFDVQERPTAIKPKLSRDMARRVAVNIVRLPELLGKP